MQVSYLIFKTIKTRRLSILVRRKRSHCFAIIRGGEKRTQRKVLYMILKTFAWSKNKEKINRVVLLNLRHYQSKA